ncbi:hypothetical protein D7Y13_21665 [Corallococcus praedator]|uniref:Uncharacterized protein n=1 Tax=Corallococcus praedator TaxID=2316724 RepID=A0ABX9QGP5_9BACT|nr:hypothetical protein D7X75_28735 [Corallococcus sp. CA031C]RKI05805.1 hypothetical protein D7Y13_21665 [Corallococcus praedator]
MTRFQVLPQVQRVREARLHRRLLGPRQLELVQCVQGMQRLPLQRPHPPGSAPEELLGQRHRLPGVRERRRLVQDPRTLFPISRPVQQCALIHRDQQRIQRGAFGLRGQLLPRLGVTR